MMTELKVDNNSDIATSKSRPFRGHNIRGQNHVSHTFTLPSAASPMYSVRPPRLALCAAVCAVLAAVGLLVSSTATGSAAGWHWLGGSRAMPAPIGIVARANEWFRAYRAYTEERCVRLARGDTAEQDRVRGLVERARAAGVRQFPCYRDDYLRDAPCDELRDAAASGYVATQEELDFPLAYELRVHTCATQVELLLRSIYAPHNFYCLHVDGRSPPRFKAAMLRLATCLPNVQLARFDPHFVYASASQMDADLECMRVARASTVRWRYFMNLAGQELPLMTNLELVRLYRSLNGSSHFYVYNNTFPKRQERSHWCVGNVTGLTERCLPPYLLKPPPPRNVTVYKSYSNGAFSRAFVDYMLDDSFARELYLWFNDTLCPEEHYFATLLSLPEAPGGGWERGTRQRAMIWRWKGGGSSDHCAGRFVRLICIYVSADLPRLIQQPDPFANKLHFEDDPFAVRCLVDSIVERRRRQSGAGS